MMAHITRGMPNDVTGRPVLMHVYTEPHSSVGSVTDLKTAGRRFDPQLLILGKNTGRAGDRTGDLQFSSPQRYRLSYGALPFAYDNLEMSRNNLIWA